MGAKDLAEKNLLQYKDVFSDIVNVNLFGGRCYVSAKELSREPGELIMKTVSDKNLRQLQMDVPMKCKKNNRSFMTKLVDKTFGMLYDDSAVKYSCYFKEELPHREEVLNLIRKYGKWVNDNHEFVIEI